MGALSIKQRSQKKDEIAPFLKHRMERAVLRNDQWEGIKDLRVNCQIVEAVLWIVRTGAPLLRNLPEKLGYWLRVYMHYSRWPEKGMWDQVFEVLAADPDWKYLMVDGTIVRAHQHRAPQRTEQEAAGKSRYGLRGLCKARFS